MILSRNDNEKEQLKAIERYERVNLLWAISKGWVTTEDGEHIFINGGSAYGGQDGYVKAKEEEAGAASRAEWAKEGKGGGKYVRYSKYPESVVGVQKVTEMSFEEADEGKSNPHLEEERKYRVNCQTCVVAYEMRRRGYDVEARGKETAQQNALSRETNIVWRNPKTGKVPDFEELPGRMTSSSFAKYLDNKIQEGERYHLGFGWKSGSAGHIVTLERNNNGVVQLFDPQTNKKFTGDSLKNYFTRIQINTTKTAAGAELLRVDNLSVNERFVEHILLPASSKR